MITQCQQCGGLRADPGEMYGGKPCECLLASSDGSANAETIEFREVISYIAIYRILERKAEKLDEAALLLIESKLTDRARDARIQANILREAAEEFRAIESVPNAADEPPARGGECYAQVKTC